MIMKFHPRDVRLEFSTGWQKSWTRATHVPSGIVIEAAEGDTRADLYRKIEEELAKSGAPDDRY